MVVVVLWKKLLILIPWILINIPSNYMYLFLWLNLKAKQLQENLTSLLAHMNNNFSRQIGNFWSMTKKLNYLFMKKNSIIVCCIQIATNLFLPPQNIYITFMFVYSVFSKSSPNNVKKFIYSFFLNKNQITFSSNHSTGWRARFFSFKIYKKSGTAKNIWMH